MTTESRDRWADSKQVDLQQVFQATAGIAQELRHGLLELDKLLQQAGGAKSFRDFYAVVERTAEVSRIIAHRAHNLKSFCDLQIPPSTLFTDHFLNQFFLMSAFKRTWWVEGPAFCGQAIKQGSRILELGCGTGYYTDIFFSPFAREIVAIDVDERAIESARRLHQAANIRYEVMDFTKNLPDGPFDVAIWSPTIVAYTPDDIHPFMARLRERMVADGVLCGWTAKEADHAGPDILWHDMQSLAERLKIYFKNVKAFERIHSTVQPPRHMLFFYASDAALPFDDGWENSLRLG
jgi:SAM-dependent methyltransferase